MSNVVLCCVQDAKPLEVYSIEFMVDNNQLGFLGNATELGSVFYSCFIQNHILNI